MAVAMAIVRVMQMAVDQVVGVISMRNGFMAAERSVNVMCIMPAACMPVAALHRIDPCDRDRMLFDSPAGGLMMKVSFVQIIHMPVMFHGRVTTLLSMRVIMLGMNVC
jgi:hypothetical protein